MNEKWEEILESDLAQHLLAGVAYAGGTVFGLVAVAMGIAALFVSPWWAVGFILGGLLCGLLVGLGIYLSDQCW